MGEVNEDARRALLDELDVVEAADYRAVVSSNRWLRDRAERAERAFGRLHSTYLEMAEALRVNHDRTDRLREAANKAVQGIISSGSGPAAPCFDEYDSAVESRRGKWYKVDGQALDDLRAVLSADADAEVRSHAGRGMDVATYIDATDVRLAPEPADAEPSCDCEPIRHGVGDEHQPDCAVRRDAEPERCGAPAPFGTLCGCDEPSGHAGEHRTRDRGVLRWWPNAEPSRAEGDECKCVPDGDLHRAHCPLSLYRRVRTEVDAEGGRPREADPPTVSGLGDDTSVDGGGDDGRSRAIEAAGDRDALGRIVRLAWMEWAREQPNPKPSWLMTWANLSEPEREVDRRIGERLRDHAIDAALASGGVVTREDALHEREWGNAHFADWQRERDRVRELEATVREARTLIGRHLVDLDVDDTAWAEVEDRLRAALEGGSDGR